MKNYGLKFLLISLTAASLFVYAPVKVSAASVPWFPIVPCGLNQQPKDSSGVEIPKSVHDYTQPCNQCLLIQLGQNLINMTFFAIVPVVGTLFFIWAGIIILFGGRNGDTAAITKGRKLILNTAIGIAIILGSWLITNFILVTLAGNNNTIVQNWSTIQCTTGTLENLVNSTVPSTGTGGGGGSGGGGGDTGTGSGGANNGVQCPQSNLNFCQGSAPQGCANSSCSQYAAMINTVASQVGGLATANVLKAIMETESSCQINGNSGSSYGLMQIKPPIPEIYGTRCGLSKAQVDGIDQSWLTNPANAQTSICIAAQFINAIGQSQCGTNLADLYAGYNGGQNAGGACSPSKDCTGTVCGDTPVKAWECLYNDTAHTQCNTGPHSYDQTRQGASRVLACSTNPGF